MASRYYKEQYLISIYDETEMCRGTCDNVAEFADRFGLKNKTAHALISKLTHGKKQYFSHGGSRFTIHLIPLELNDIIEIERASKNEITTKMQSMRLHTK